MTFYARRPPSRDANEAEIVTAIVMVGWGVHKLDSRAEPGLPDLLVWCRRMPHLWRWVEVKMPEAPVTRKNRHGQAVPNGKRGGSLTPAQVEWHRRWSGPRIVIGETGQQVAAELRAIEGEEDADGLG